MTPADDEPATYAGLRALLGEHAAALDTATEARDVHTTIGPAACGAGAGPGPSSMRAAARPDNLGVRRADDRSPVPAAFLAHARRRDGAVG
ncbi:hypothetical protein AB0G32_31205 [Streptomyces sp. NPDC023723]|uniref:hypothetical protein n=1 Tax=Streptomyces sp. NPDC023723 TaxID=3154323 RepID=UPI0033E19AE8